MLSEIQKIAFKYVIVKGNLSETNKKILLFLLEESVFLHKPIHVTISEKDGFSLKEINNLNELENFFPPLLLLSNSNMRLNCNRGYYSREPDSGIYTGNTDFLQDDMSENNVCYTIWLTCSRMISHTKSYKVSSEKIKFMNLDDEIYKRYSESEFYFYPL